MQEKFITKGEDVLTRVSLEIDGNRFTVESLYCDSDLLEDAMQCVDAALSLYDVKKDVLLNEMKNVINGEHPKYCLELAKEHKIKLIMEQWDGRHIVEATSSFNFAHTLVDCVKSCAVLSTYIPSSVDDFFGGYIEENEELENLEGAEEDQEDEDASTVSIEA